MVKKWISPAILVTATLLFAGSAVILMRPPRQVRPPASDVVAQITTLQNLGTTEYRYRDVIYFGEQSRFLGLPAGSREVLFALTITVTAGIDFSGGVQVQWDENRPSRAYVTLPAAGVLRVNAEERSIQQYYSRERGGRIDWIAVSDVVEEAKTRNRTDAINRGILVRAEERTRDIVTRMLRASGVDEVEIRFRPSGGVQG